MLILGDYTASLAPAALVVALALAILPFCPRDSAIVRALLFLTAGLLSWRYMFWRATETIPGDGLDALFGWAFAFMEASTVVSSSLAFFILSRSMNRSREADLHTGWWRPGPAPLVDVLIATYNEEEPILERTIAGSMALAHERVRVWVLDDGRRPWLEALCTRLGARYLTRVGNDHAKAGNINAALRILRQDPEPPDFIAVLDADFIPHRDFLDRTLALFHDQSVGLVQTPQHFFNSDPIQHNLGIGNAYPDEQRFFFDHVEPARDAWGIAACCGTSSVIRFTALENIGGFATESVTEDFLVTLRLQESGFSTVYLGEPLTEGLAPEGLGEYITQRGRWCLGMMQIARGSMGPFSKNRLRFIDRISVLDSVLYWSTAFPFRLCCLILPMLYWLCGITAVNAPVLDVLFYFVPAFLSVSIALNWVSGGLLVPVLNDVSQIIAAPAITRAVAIGLFRPKGHKFKVTAKGGDRSKVVVQWPLIKPLLAVFLLTTLGLLLTPLTDISFGRDAGDGKIVILFWSLYNLVVLAVAMAVCVEAPRSTERSRSGPERVSVGAIGSEVATAWLTNLSVAGAWIRGGPFFSPGASIVLGINEVGPVAATVVKADPSGFEASLQIDPEQRARILAKMHTREGVSGVTSTDLSGIAKGMLRQALRRRTD